MDSIPTIDPEIAALFEAAITDTKVQLLDLNRDIHEHPELAYQEHHAHDAIVNTLTKLGYKTTPHAYGIPTSFEAEYGSGGRLVVFNAEYDALPEIGHACGHNLIAIASFAGFIATASALKASGKPGRVRLLGTPAEEGGCGKGMLIGKGAFEGVDASVMAHPSPLYQYRQGLNGNAYAPHVGVSIFTIEFKGKTAHAAASPWDGVNAVDAAVLGYNAVSMMRQQMRPKCSVHGIFTDAGLISNIIPDHSAVDYCVRAPSIKEVVELRNRVIDCFRAGAVASGCEMTVKYDPTYAPLRPSKILSKVFADAMEALEVPMECDVETKEVILGSTDQGNVGCVVPVIHPIYGIEAEEGQFNHTRGFTKAAGSQSSFERTLKVANGLARTAWVILTDDDCAANMKREFQRELEVRRNILSAEEEFAMIKTDKYACKVASSRKECHCKK